MDEKIMDELFKEQKKKRPKLLKGYRNINLQPDPPVF